MFFRTREFAITCYYSLEHSKEQSLEGLETAVEISSENPVARINTKQIENWIRRQINFQIKQTESFGTESKIILVWFWNESKRRTLKKILETSDNSNFFESSGSRSRMVESL